jgi:PAS domain S-box-containing protein
MKSNRPVPTAFSAPDRKLEQAVEVDALVRLNELSSRLWRARSLHEGLEEMLSASIELLGADMGHVRLVDEVRDMLVIAAQRGFSEEFVASFQARPLGTTSASARALQRRERAIIQDIEGDEQYAPLRAVARRAGYRAVQSTPLLSHAGKAIGIVTTHFRMPHRPAEQDLRKFDLYARQASDFVERFKAEEALRASEARYRAVVENQSEMVCRFRPDGTILFVNTAYANSLGTTPEQLNGANFWDRIADKDRPAVRAMLGSLTPQAPLVRIENRFTTRDGERWTLWTNRALSFDQNGTLLEAQASGIDITDRKRFEEALATSARRMSALYELTDRLQRISSVADVYETAMDAIIKALGCSRAAILLFDEEGVMRFVASRGLSQAYRKAVEGHSPWRPTEIDASAFGVADVRSMEIDAGVKAAILNEGIAALAFVPLVSERRLIGKFMIYCDAPRDFEHGEFDVALTIGHQVAFAVQRRRVEEERQRAVEALREDDRRKDEFLAMLSHELRNPLAPLRNAVQVLRLTEYGSAQTTGLHDMMSRQIDHLVRLVDDLLEMSRISRGTLDLKKERVALAIIVQNAVETSDPLIRSAGHRIEIDLPAETLWTDGDPVRLAQILSNLLNNAARYTPPGGRISVRAREDGAMLAITVRDTGIGIAPEVLPRVFEMFNRGDRSSAGGEPGLGIGLALSSRLAKMHGGSIEARSDGKGTGSEFTLRLPLAESGDAVTAAATSAGADIAQQRILIVDDNCDAGDSLGMLLQCLGADVRIARDGSEALREFADYQPAVVLLDIGMPEMDGYEVARRIRTSFPGRRTPLVAVTGWGQEEDKKRAREAGFDHHLIKPADVHALQTLLATLNN